MRDQESDIAELVPIIISNCRGRRASPGQLNRARAQYRAGL
jgi:hypothetical protein